jgi:vitamin B12 transporter
VQRRIALRNISLALFSCLLSVAGLAADVSIHITDSDANSVAGARITIYQSHNDHLVTTLTSDSAGTVALTNITPGSYRIEAQAPGFARKTLTAQLGNDSRLDLQLAVASQPETVVVTGAETPVTTNETGAPTEIVTNETLINRQPVSAADAIRFLPGAIVAATGRRGGITSLFVRGGDSRYNKVIIDGVPVNDPGGTFDFGVVSTVSLDRIEFLRGPESVIYGSEAMTSTVQMFSSTGHTRTPELRFGADGGTNETAHGFASLAGAYNRFDYNLFGDQFNTNGQGENDTYSNSAVGANLGIVISQNSGFRFRTRHSTERSGIPGANFFNGRKVINPDQDQLARQNNFLASAEFDLTAPTAWRHSFTVFEYNHRRLNQDQLADNTCGPPAFLDCPFTDKFNVNRAGFDYRGEYSPRSWTRSLFGYEFEDENGFIDQDFSGFTTFSHGLRRNHAVYGEQLFNFSRISASAGVRYVHNESFGDRGIPHAALTLFVGRGGNIVSATRLRFAYGEAIKEPRLEESFGVNSAFGVLTLPNKNLKAEQNRSLEGGIVQELFSGHASISAIYFNNLFRNQIAFKFDPVTFESQYVNINSSLAHGGEFEFHSRPTQHLSVDASYTYTSTQILRAPLTFDPLLAAGRPFLRRPRHAGTITTNYFARRWGGNISTLLIGRRPDSDFGLLSSLGLRDTVDHVPGYGRIDAGGWYALASRVTAYLNIENLLNHRYEEVAGYPALKANFRAGLRFRIGGE